MSPTEPAIPQRLQVALHQHVANIGTLRNLSDRLERLEVVPRDEAEQAVRDAIAGARTLTELLHEATTMVGGSSGPNLPAADREALIRLVETTTTEVQAALQTLPRERLLQLIAELESGTIDSGRERRDRRVRKKRDQAVEELGQMALDTDTEIADFAAPAEAGARWLLWFWAQDERERDDILEELEERWPLFVDLLDGLDPDHWTPGAEPTVEPGTEPGPPNTPTDAGNSSARDSGAAAGRDGAPDNTAQGDVDEDAPTDVDEPETLPTPAGPASKQREKTGRTVPGGTPRLKQAPLRPELTKMLGGVGVPSLLGGGPTASPTPPAPEATSLPKDEETAAPPPARPTPADHLESKSEPSAAPEQNVVPIAPPPSTPAADSAPQSPTQRVPEEEPAQSSPGNAPTEASQPEARVQPEDEPVDEPDTTRGGPTKLPVARPRPTMPAPRAVEREEFVRTAWLRFDGENTVAERAPWLKSDFAERLLEAQATAVLAGDRGAALLFARAGAARAVPGVASVAWLHAVAGFGRGYEVDLPESAHAVVRSFMAARVDATPLAGTPSAWIRFALAVLADPESSADASFVSEVSALLELSEPITALLGEWLIVRAGIDPFQQLTAQLDQSAPTTTDVATALDSARKELRDYSIRVYKAVGGKVERTHCREAWDRFMSEAWPTIKRIADGEVQDGDERRIQAFRDTAKKIFNKGGAKFKDRSAMDNAERNLRRLCQDVVDRHRELATTRTNVGPGSSGPVFTEAALFALDPTQRELPDTSGWIARLIWGHLENDRTWGGETVLTEDRLRARPVLVEAWTDPAFPIDALDPLRAADPTLAAARLLDDALPKPAKHLEAWLAEHRPDIVESASGLKPTSTHRINEALEDRENEIHDLATRFNTLTVHLAELADPQLPIAQDALRRADAATEVPPSALERMWLRETAARLAQRVQHVCDDVAADAIEAGRDPAIVDEILKSGHFGGLLRLLSRTSERRDTQSLRATVHRKMAERQWESPHNRLHRLTMAESKGDESAALSETDTAMIRTWADLRRALRRRSPRTDESAALRDAFAEWVFRRTERQRKGRIAEYTPKRETAHLQINLDDVREWLVADQRNPTFLPQLARYRDLVVKVCPVGTRERALAQRIHREARSNDITVVLVPSLDRGRRDEIRDYLSSHTLAGPLAIIDDLDLCRVFNPNGEPPPPLLGLLEIVAEQQPMRSFCPYEVVEGQHVRMEMFVGRDHEARMLAQERTYGRIFSGRRLGKTALLRFVGAHPDHRRLPSGNTLQVVFCSIAGEESEEKVALSIIRSVKKHLGAPMPSEEQLVNPVAFLKRFIDDIRETHKEWSWLILLDEADSFFGAQIRAQTARSDQGSLSWWMSRHGEKVTDSRGVPLVRFVLCGYLRTDQNRGVWENKGDVLRLGPLQPREAVQLAAGPLERMGIDARAQAENIAFQCGYQPAVLVRFGFTLVEHLDRNRARQAREGLRVERQDVTEVFLSNGVQRAIAEACWLNFVGHPTGQLVFAAFLMELRDGVASAAVDDAPARLLARIREVKDDFDPAEHIRENWSDAVHQLLKELVDRSLLMQVSHRPAAHRLRFPHHLPVLLQKNPGHYVLDALSRLGAAPAEETTTWLLTESQIGQMRWYFSEDAAELEAQVAVASHWLEPLADPVRGLGPRLARHHTGEPPPILQGPEAMSALSAGGGPALLLGGPALGAKALAAGAEGDEVELIASGRFGVQQVHAWFQRRRAAEFTSLDAMNHIMAATGGIPLLVRTLDEFLTAHHDEAPTLGERELSALLGAVEAALPAMRARICDPGDPIGLDARHIELLRLVCRASAEEPGDPEMMRLVLSEGEVYDLDVTPYEPQDATRLSLLVALGLLPRATTSAGGALESVGAVPADDPLRKLVLRADA